jgi:predicted ribosomally synthesized peptide with nif11-like leader
MSASEAERFVDDLKTSPDLLDELKKGTAGLGLSGVVEFAKQKGYSMDVDDAKAYIETKARKELTDEQLDRIAGGKDRFYINSGYGTGYGSGTPSPAATSAVLVANTYAEAEAYVLVGGAVVGVVVLV